MRFRSFVRRRLRAILCTPSTAKYHFIHIPKNAGEAVRDALYFQREVSLSSPFHYRYIDIVEHVGSHLKFFSVIRNPWSRTLSRFQFARQNASRWAPEDPRRIYIEKATFSDFVRDRKIFDIPEHPGMPWMGPMSSWFNQLEWIRNNEGDVACTCVRMEYLKADLEELLNRKLKLRAKNVTRGRGDYRSMYTDDLAELVSSYFREDISYFGFSFDSAATRHVLTPA